MTGILGHARTALLAAALLVGGPTLVAGDALAAPPAPGARAPASNRVQIGVMVVYANNSGQVDPRLRSLQRQLEMMRFTGFKLLDQHDDTLGVNQATTLQVEGGRRVQITLVSRDEENAQIRVQVFKDNEKKVDTTLTTKRGRTVVIGIGKYQDGSLVLPVTVSD
ncbi:MAG: hypothetical protein H6738_07285 [Alphaproteobacteria bacterium]|nr:hypothetical protein [Alphaproteobacteria bacterium]MCB9696566.1 hypothetical protein [Alphaproteobacteria bacterium]